MFSDQATAISLLNKSFEDSAEFKKFLSNLSKFKSRFLPVKDALVCEKMFSLKKFGELIFQNPGPIKPIKKTIITIITKK